MYINVFKHKEIVWKDPHLTDDDDGGDKNDDSPHTACTMWQMLFQGTFT